MNRKWKLFLIFLRIGAFTFGGGYAMIPLIEREIVEKNDWLRSDEFMDVLAVCQSTPGAMAVNQAVFIGYKLEGVPGAITAALGVILPSFTIILAIAASFGAVQKMAAAESVFKGVRPAVVALILTAGLRLLSRNRTVYDIGLVVLSFSAIAFLHINPIFVVIAAAIMGLLRARIAKGGA